MTTESASVAQITACAVSLLCRELGPVNTARFINQFTNGSGDYTEDREAILGNRSVAEIVSEIKNRRAESLKRRKKARFCLLPTAYCLLTPCQRDATRS